jgi:trehalose synthase
VNTVPSPTALVRATRPIIGPASGLGETEYGKDPAQCGPLGIGRRAVLARRREAARLLAAACSEEELVDEAVIPSAPATRFDEVLPPERAAGFLDAVARFRKVLGPRTLWHINSTEHGGGVAELLQSLLCYLAGEGVPIRWLVIDGNDGFFDLTKRIHHLLHGKQGDGGALGEAEKDVYESALLPDIHGATAMIRPGDPVVLHDPQTLGMAPALARAGARVIWSCHVGADIADARSRSAWGFLMPYLEGTERQVFSRPQYVWEGLDTARTAIIPPCIDAFSPKNQDLDGATVLAILAASGVTTTDGAGSPDFVRQDGSPAKVSSAAELVGGTPVPVDAPLVVQVSRWDRLKDHAGVMAGFVSHVPRRLGAHLVLAGPAPDAVADDPESRETLDQLRRQWESLDAPDQARVHIACLPMGDVEENGAIVNAIQRQAAVVVQKSLAEGFGLTVTEAMWKARPVVATRVGGIQDQVRHGETGLLIDDARDIRALGRAVTLLLEDGGTARRLGQAAHERVRDQYLAPRHLIRYFELIESAMAPA